MLRMRMLLMFSISMTILFHHDFLRRGVLFTYYNWTEKYILLGLHPGNCYQSKATAQTVMQSCSHAVMQSCSAEQLPTYHFTLIVLPNSVHEQSLKMYQTEKKRCIATHMQAIALVPFSFSWVSSYSQLIHS